MSEIKKLKVMTILGTRPEIIRLSCVIAKLDKYCDHILVHTGQNYDYELNEVFFDDLNIKRPNHFLHAAGENASQTIGKIIISIDKILEEEAPDAVLILGDTNSSLAAIPVKRHKIPLFHMEAGNRCFDQRVPEEINRKMIDHIADINLTYSSIAREYLLAEGLSADRIIKTGSPMFEVLGGIISKFDKSSVVEKLGLKSENYFVVSLHREENVDNDINLEKFALILNTLAKNYSLPIIVSAHPRTRKRIEDKKIEFHENVKLMKPLGFIDYIKLQVESKLVLSDSGTISEESSILNFPAVNIREAHERPESFEEGSVMMVGLELDRVLQAMAILENQPRGDERLLELVEDYSSPNVSDKVLRIILSYTNYVNRNVWHKDI